MLAYTRLYSKNPMREPPVRLPVIHISISLADGVGAVYRLTLPSTTVARQPTEDQAKPLTEFKASSSSGSNELIPNRI